MTAISTALVLDRQLLCRRGLASIVQHRFPYCNVESSGDLDRARAWLDALASRALLIVDGGIDLGLLDAGGIRGLRARYPLLSLAVVDWRRDQRVALRAIADGAHAYIPKDLEQSEMLQAFDLVMSGQVYVPSNVGDFAQDIAREEPENPSLSALTERQCEVLTHMSMGKSNKEIGRSLQISESTVKVHVAAAFRQLGVHNRVGAVAMLQNRSARHNPVFDEAIKGFGRRLTDRDTPKRAFG